MGGSIHSRIVVGEVADSDFAPLILERESRRSRRLVAVFAVASLSLADRGDELDELVALECCRRCRRALTLEILEKEGRESPFTVEIGLDLRGLVAHLSPCRCLILELIRDSPSDDRQADTCRQEESRGET